MLRTSSVIVGLEIGTSKICAIVGEVNENEELNITGIGQSRSRGVRKGEIVDSGRVEEDIRVAIDEAEKMSDVEIRSVYLGVTGSHISCLTNRGVHPVASVDREIMSEDVEDAIKNAKAVRLPADNEILHATRQHFVVDGQEGVIDPVGRLGSRVEVDMHVIHGNLNRLQNPIRAVKNLQLEVEAVAFSGLASALSVLSPEQRKMGALVIDLGGGVTNFIVYGSGAIKHAGVLAVGGDHVSNDLAYGLKTPLQRAEQLKVDYGCAVVSESTKGQTVTIAAELGVPAKTINLQHLHHIMSSRVEEMFQLIEQDIAATGLLNYLGAGVVLCGGGSRTPRIQEVAERIFGLPVSLGRADSISGIKSALDEPEFATAIGLVRFGSFQEKRKAVSPGFTQTLKQALGGLLRRAML
ncbi:MAG: cell division protein FtsA [Verrucomicrobia bacterium]|nr:cell division protein FtsA [Verrucomicrobiota bacterium]MBI3867737.1 cell division protein FtsA [Verrucomicrobiota bacterium]